MKTNKFLKFTTAVILTGLVVLSGCKLKMPTENVTVIMKPDAVSAPYSFGFIDAKTGFTVTDLEGQYVDVTGPGASYLYTTDGFRKFKIVNGQIGICVRKGANPSPENPIKFDINFNVSGYLPLSFHYEITNVIPTNQSISVTNLSNLPSNIAAKDTTIVVTTSGLTTPLSFTSKATDSLPETNTITLPAGTKFVDANGNPFAGNVTLNFLSSETKGSSAGLFSGNPLTTKYTKPDGTPDNQSYLPLSTSNISFSGSGKVLNVVYADGKQHYEFNSPKICFTTYYLPLTYSFLNFSFSDNLVTYLDYDSELSSPYDGYVFNAIGFFEIIPTYVFKKAKFTNPSMGRYYDFKIRYEIKSSTGGMLYNVTRDLSSISDEAASNSYELMTFATSGGTLNAKAYLDIYEKGTSNQVASHLFIGTDEATYTLPTPTNGTGQYIAKFAVYCKDQKAYMSLPTGWKVYFIKRSVYDSKIVNGHKVQPADKTGDYLEISASEPVFEANPDKPGELIAYNVIKVPVSALESLQEYIVCTYFGSQGLVFNDFNNTKGEGGKLITPDLTNFTNTDLVDGVRRMDINCD